MGEGKEGGGYIGLKDFKWDDMGRADRQVAATIGSDRGLLFTVPIGEGQKKDTEPFRSLQYRTE